LPWSGGKINEDVVNGTCGVFWICVGTCTSKKKLIYLQWEIYINLNIELLLLIFKSLCPSNTTISTFGIKLVYHPVFIVVNELLFKNEIEIF